MSAFLILRVFYYFILFFYSGCDDVVSLGKLARGKIYIERTFDLFLQFNFNLIYILFYILKFLEWNIPMITWYVIAKINPLISMNF